MKFQKITKISKNENDKEILKEIPKERYISPEERQSIIMEYQKIVNLLGNTPNKPSKCRMLG